MYSNKELSQKLKANLPQTNFIDTLKIAYRPYICPFDELLMLIEKEKKVFDIGCGSGMFLTLVAEYNAPAKIGGIEIAEGLVKNAIDLLKPYNVPFFLSKFDGINLPEEIREYDYIFLIDVFHHVPKENQKEFVRRIYDIMKPGAKLIFKDIDASQKILVLFNKLHDLVLSKEIGNEIGAAEAQNLLERNGLKIQSSKYIRTLWYPHYLIICEK
ncbi:MAG: class I SAM-dependent methyltransferase [Sporocytophaga sp.]|uniref:class I SAM-dependent methyltransferase n=1 Tax=Sporocytophaga sp. TaxID=2231183 RepID=UPI001B0959FE|nr:class I SAM-dependent methyltransferase [Sporocytophaga sp.]MBO9700725.1 class I SAM-dependent methyltransferase [Sporocytophaga sp.]